MRLITISGVDGSGKSTQLARLRTKLGSESRNVAYFHAVEFSLANRLSRIFGRKKDFVPGGEKAVTEASWCSLTLRKLFLAIDIFRFKTLVRRLARDGYDTILSDRYFYDSAVNILYLSAGTTTGSIFLERFIPRPDKAFYLHITPEEVMRRERVPEQGADYLRRKIAIFEDKKKDWRMIDIDASRDESAVAADIVGRLG